MNEEDKKAFADLKEQIEEMQLIIRELQSNKRVYSQNEIFDTRITFKKPVYNRFGERVIN